MISRRAKIDGTSHSYKFNNRICNERRIKMDAVCRFFGCEMVGVIKYRLDSRHSTFIQHISFFLKHNHPRYITTSHIEWLKPYSAPLAKLSYTLY